LDIRLPQSQDRPAGSTKLSPYPAIAPHIR
jgi:hypothetical protein